MPCPANPYVDRPQTPWFAYIYVLAGCKSCGISQEVLTLVTVVLDPGVSSVNKHEREDLAAWAGLSHLECCAWLHWMEDD